MSKEKYYQLISRYLSGELSDKEKIDLDNWIKESDENRQLFNSLNQLWTSVETPEPDAVPPFEKIWEKVDKEITAPEKKYSPAGNLQLNTPKTIKDFWSSLFAGRRKYAFATIIIFVLGIGVLTRYAFNANPYLQVKTAYSQQKTLVLPDGSQINLNSDTIIKYNKTFSDTLRTVYLSGQAFFQIKHDGRPFVVKTDNAQIRVLGTKFDVKSRNLKTQVVVQEGCVELESTTLKTNNVILQKNEMGVCEQDLNISEPKTVDAMHLVGWLNNTLVFEMTPLREIVQDLERFYNKKIVLVDDSIGSKTMTGEFKNQSIDQVLFAICTTLDLTYSVDKDVYLIKQKQ